MINTFIFRFYMSVTVPKCFEYGVNFTLKLCVVLNPPIYSLGIKNYTQ